MCLLVSTCCCHIKSPLKTDATRFDFDVDFTRLIAPSPHRLSIRFPGRRVLRLFPHPFRFASMACIMNDANQWIAQFQLQAPLPPKKHASSRLETHWAASLVPIWLPQLMRSHRSCCWSCWSCCLMLYVSISKLSLERERDRQRDSARVAEARGASRVVSCNLFIKKKY